MLVSLTEKEFSQHIVRSFTASSTSVSQEIEQGGMVRFSVFFVGPADPYLPQPSIGWSTST